MKYIKLFAISESSKMSPYDWFRAIESGDMKSIENYLNEGNDINTFSLGTGFTALHLACSKGKKKVIDFLISKGADINLPANEIARTQTGFTPLMVICANSFDWNKESRYLTIKKFLDLGANVNTQSRGGSTALMLLCDSSQPNDYEIVKLLLDKGANPNLIDTKGYNAVNRCVNGWNPSDSFLLLLDNAGADLEYASKIMPDNKILNHYLDMKNEQL